MTTSPQSSTNEAPEQDLHPSTIFEKDISLQLSLVNSRRTWALFGVFSLPRLCNLIL